MKKAILFCITFLFFVSQGITQITEAEDLWGNKIDFDGLIQSGKTILIQPVSPANCGYCLIDGYFVETNYFGNNRKYGGENFYQCLFNPQLDIYSYTKHYRDSETPVLTYPVALHEFHQDGFPVILAFRSGKQILALPDGSLWPYDKQFQKLKKILWKSKETPFVPTSDMHFATRNIDENSNGTARVIIPDGDTAGFRIHNVFMKKFKNGEARYLSRITEEDKNCHLFFDGKFTSGLSGLFGNTSTPVTFDGDSVLVMDNYRFPLDDIGLTACFPNPYNPQRYVILSIRGENVKRRYYENSVDYVLYRNADSGSGNKVLAHGFFGKIAGKPWFFTDSLASLSPELKSFCAGVCKIPLKRPIIRHERKPGSPVVTENPTGITYTFGEKGCRFPATTTGNDGTLWIAWEEGGDILLTSLNQQGKQIMTTAECDNSDSYLPLLAASGNQVWIFYLNNRDGFYRLVGRSFDGIRFSDEILISDREPFDVFSADVNSDRRDNVVLAWAVWKANNRFLYTRTIRNNSPEPISPVKTLLSKGMGGYTDAWSPSLSLDGNGTVWGAWNQHYPSTLGVCAGTLSGESVSVTRLEEDMDNNENGGYPSTLTEKSGRRWIFYESFGWDVLNGESQKIRAVFSDPSSGKWSLPAILTADTALMMNQTPVCALMPDGRIVVVWSGRVLKPGNNWGLYLSWYDGAKWSLPKRITGNESASRAPKIVSGEDGTLWITYHSGIGTMMKVNVLKTNLDKIFGDAKKQ